MWCVYLYVEVHVVVAGGGRRMACDRIAILPRRVERRLRGPTAGGVK